MLKKHKNQGSAQGSAQGSSYGGFGTIFLPLIGHDIP